MTTQSNYKKQENLSFVQFLSELPNTISLIFSAIISRSLIVFLDLYDSCSELLRTAIIALLSKKLSKNLKYEYNYGVGKIDSIAALLCDSIVFLGGLLGIGLSIYQIFFPNKPSDLLIIVVGIKLINVTFDSFFMVNQRKILKAHNSAVARSNYQTSIASFMFDLLTLISLLVIWLLRNNVVGEYLPSIISIFISVYLIIGCIKRTKTALDELTDKTLPEETQLKILSIMSKYYQEYCQLNSIKSRKSGDDIQVDLHLSFDNDTTYEQMISLKHKLQIDFKKQIENSTINIIIEEG